MLLALLTYFFVSSVGVAALTCLALGLFSLSQYIECHAARARRLGLRALYVVAFVQQHSTMLDLFGQLRPLRG